MWLKSARSVILRSFREQISVFLIVALMAPSLSTLAQGIDTRVSPLVKKIPLVALLVEESLAKNAKLYEKIQRYEQDVSQTLDVQTVRVEIPKEADPFEIYEGLAHLYHSGLNLDGKTQLEGIVLIGEVPIPVVEKNKVFWPTIYPYVDLENPRYRWDREEERFILSGGGKSIEPELWHGVIRSFEDSPSAQIDDLIRYFDSNHEVHQGNATFTNRIFSLDPRSQLNAFPPEFFERYKKWIEHGEDFFYQRWTKSLAQKLLNLDSNFEVPDLKNDPVYGQMYEDYKNYAAPDIKAEDLKHLPDMYSKFMIEGQTNRYLSAYANWLRKIYDDILQAGRWPESHIDTTISLITRKDEASFLILKAFNDALEKRIREEVQQNSISSGGVRLHVEPTTSTLKNLSPIKELKVDDPRGFSFTDHNNGKHRLNFVNVFDLRNPDVTPQQFRTRLRNNIRGLVQQLNSIAQNNNRVREANVSRTIRSNITEDLIEEVGLDILHSAVSWLDKDINTKNEIAFESLMDHGMLEKEFFISLESDGYELTHFVFHDSDRGVEFDFEPNPNEESYDLAFAQEKTKSATYRYKKDDFVPGVTNKPSSSNANNSGGGGSPGGGGGGCGGQSHLVDQIKCEIGQSISNFRLKQQNQKNEDGTNPPKTPTPEYKLHIISNDIISFGNEEETIPLRVEIRDNAGNLAPEKTYTPVSLEFSSADGEKLFQVLPSQTVETINGVANLYLKRKEADFGARMTVKATTPHRDTADSDSIPVIVSRYTLEPFVENKTLVAGKEGLSIGVQVKNIDGNVEPRFDGKEIEVEIFGEGRVTSAENFLLQNGQTQFTFTPGTKSETVVLSITDPRLAITPVILPLNVFPDAPADLEVRTSAPVLLEDQVIQVDAALVDQYGNPIFQARHDLEWKTKNAEVLESSKVDADSNNPGIQQRSIKGVGQLFLRPTEWEKEMEVEVTSSFLPDITKSVRLKSVRNPSLSYDITKASARAGSESPIRITLRALDEQKELIPVNNPIFIHQTPASFGHFPEDLVFEEGVAYFEFYPKTISGKFKLRLSSPGLGSVVIPFSIEPGVAAKIEMESDKKDYAAGEPIVLNFTVKDAYQNTLSSYNGNISIGASAQTAHLVSSASESVKMEKGRGALNLGTTGERGKLHLYARGTNLVGDTLEIPIRRFYSDDNFAAFAPKSLLTVVEQERGLWDKNNVVHRLLQNGKTQAVGTYLNPRKPQKQYGVVASDGSVSETFGVEFVEQSYPTVLLSQNRTPLALARILVPGNTLYLNKPKNKAGVFIDSYSQQAGNLSISRGQLRYRGNPILDIDSNGSPEILNQKLKLLPQISKSLLGWELVYDGIDLGRMTYYAPKMSVEFVSEFESRKTDLLKIQLKSASPEITFQSVFTGNTTNTEMGVAVLHKYLRESQSKTFRQDRRIWRGKWKPGTLFGGQNSVGLSFQRGASEDVIVLGDPTLSLDMSRGYRLDTSIGRSLWQSTEGRIDKIFTLDTNQDQQTDILALVGDRLHLLYQDRDGGMEFKDMGVIYTFEERPKDLSVMIVGGREVLLAVEDGALTQYIFENGIVRQIPLEIDSPNPIVKIKPAKLNEDNILDFVFLDEKNQLFVVYGGEDGFETPLFLEGFAPEFATVEETWNHTDNENNSLFLYGTLLTYDDIADIAGPLNVVDLARFEEDPDGTRRLFTRITDSHAALAEASFAVEPVNGPEIQNGDKVKVTLRLKSGPGISNAHIVLPRDRRFAFVRSSVQCNGCGDALSVKPYASQQKVRIALGSFASGEIKQVTFEYTVNDVPPIQFYVADFEQGADDIDDIKVPWNDGVCQKIFNFLSTTKLDNSDLPYGPMQEEDLGCGESSGADLFFEKIAPIIQNAEDPDRALSQFFLDSLNKDSDGDGVPDNTDLYPDIPGTTPTDDGGSTGGGTTDTPATNICAPTSEETSIVTTTSEGSSTTGNTTTSTSSSSTTTTTSQIGIVNNILHFPPGQSWDYRIGSVPSVGNREVYVMDLFDANIQDINDFQDQGKKVVCYFNAGALQRGEQGQGLGAYSLGQQLDGWDEEWLDIRQSGLRQEMVKRLDLAAQKGCDGVEPDNVDGYDNNTPLTKGDAVDYLTFLAAEAHKRGLAIAHKNSAATP